MLELDFNQDCYCCTYVESIEYVECSLTVLAIDGIAVLVFIQIECKIRRFYKRF